MSLQMGDETNGQEGAVRHCVVVGGGSAGWLTACLIAAEHCANEPGGMRVTLIESPNVPTIGVGEGTWPTMRDTLRRIGISETDFLKSCNASFKQGTCFDDWIGGAAGGDRYYHPFVVPQGYGDVTLMPEWRRRFANIPFAEAVCFQPHLCAEGRASKQITTPEYAAVATYGYHLDAGKFAALLKRHGTEHLGIHHICDDVIQVEARGNGDVAAVQCERGERVPGDLFIDCSGSAGLLLAKHYSIPFRDRTECLFNDTALAVSVPYSSDNDPIASQTLSTAREAGWIWDIGLSSRRGVGYVYSSAHTDDERAHDVLRRYLAPGSSSDQLAAIEPRKISFRSGHRATLWHRNCVAVGMAAGFIEPLEASALVMIELAAGMIAGEMPPHRDAMAPVAKRFNERFAYRWERIVEFLKLHYVLSGRNEDYWRDNRCAESVPERLAENMALWRHRAPTREDFPQTEEIFPAASYHYILYGMGFETAPRPVHAKQETAERADACFHDRERITRKYLSGLPSNRELLDHIEKQGLPRI